MTREEAVWYVNHTFEIIKEELCNSGRFDEAKEFEIAQNMAIEALQDDWIPVSERLPSDGGNYLITVADLRLGHIGEHTVTMADFYAKEKKWNSIVDVYAWMPLPTPYKVGDDE